MKLQIDLTQEEKDYLLDVQLQLRKERKFGQVSLETAARYLIMDHKKLKASQNRNETTANIEGD